MGSALKKEFNGGAGPWFAALHWAAYMGIAVEERNRVMADTKWWMWLHEPQLTYCFFDGYLRWDICGGVDGPNQLGVLFFWRWHYCWGVYDTTTYGRWFCTSLATQPRGVISGARRPCGRLRRDALERLEAQGWDPATNPCANPITTCNKETEDEKRPVE